MLIMRYEIMLLYTKTIAILKRSIVDRWFFGENIDDKNVITTGL